MSHFPGTVLNKHVNLIYEVPATNTELLEQGSELW